MAGKDTALLRVENITKHFPLGGGLPWSRAKGQVQAVNGVSFEMQPHKTLSLVGESGCGKTTTARMILRLENPTAGRIIFEGRDVTKLAGSDLRKYWNAVQAVFQDPWSSLNPRMRARDFIGEPLEVNRKARGRELRDKVTELLLEVGLEPGDAGNYPHEFSGGMRQRLAIARALALRPSLICLDEPVSALDVSIRAQIMNLLKDLQDRFGIAYLLIAHDLATVRYLSQQVVVMYLGQVVESAPAEELFAHPCHPYTKALISAALPRRLGPDGGEVLLSGDVPSPTNPPPGCRFHTRCPCSREECALEAPQLTNVAPGHAVACRQT